MSLTRLCNPPLAGKPVDKIGTNAGLSTAQHAAALFIPAMPQRGRLFSMPSLRMQWIEKQRKKHVFPREAADLLRRLIQKNKRHSKAKNIFSLIGLGRSADVYVRALSETVQRVMLGQCLEGVLLAALEHLHVSARHAQRSIDQTARAAIGKDVLRHSKCKNGLSSKALAPARYGMPAEGATTASSASHTPRGRQWMKVLQTCFQGGWPWAGRAIGSQWLVRKKWR